MKCILVDVNRNLNCVSSENDAENCSASTLLPVTVSYIFPSLSSTEVRHTPTVPSSVYLIKKIFGVLIVVINRLLHILTLTLALFNSVTSYFINLLIDSFGNVQVGLVGCILVGLESIAMDYMAQIV